MGRLVAASTRLLFSLFSHEYHARCHTVIVNLKFKNLFASDKKCISPEKNYGPADYRRANICGESYNVKAGFVNALPTLDMTVVQW